MLRSYDRVVMRDWRRLAVLTMCAAYALFCLVTMPGGALTSPDSTVYLSFSPIVPVAYPAFLKLTGERGAMILQPLIYASVLAWLGIETLLTTVNFPVAAAVVLGAIAIPDLAAYHASILTESLFMSALVAKGAKRFVDVGPGRVLERLVKRNVEEVQPDVVAA